jgi:pimeloyl-ACP methyl ester carboxylesterase
MELVADGSGWEAVAKILKNDGYKVSGAQPPETSYADDQKYTKAAIDAMDGPVVLVGHSYGGSIITEAGIHPKVAALVYIAAFALDEGESCASIEQAVPQASKAFKPDGNGNWWIVEEQFAADFAADIPREKAWFMAISQVPISTDSFTHKVTKAAWKTKPTWIDAPSHPMIPSFTASRRSRYSYPTVGLKHATRKPVHISFGSTVDILLCETRISNYQALNFGLWFGFFQGSVNNSCW